MVNDEIKILITGDFAPRFRVADAIQNEEYASLFEEIKPLMESVDYSITNMESPLIDGGKPIEKTGPNLKASSKSIEALKYAGFDMVTLANNHIMDYGLDGLLSTMKLCSKNNIEYIGAGKNSKEAGLIKYVTLKKKVISFINVAENEWSTTVSDKPGANPLNEVRVFYQIQEAKKKSDFVILIIHGGHETYELPTPRMKILYRWFIDIGADAVIGHHTHCYSGDEIYNGKPIVYSLGNFLFDHETNRNTSWNRCAVAVLNISDESIEIKLIPLCQCNEDVGVHFLNEVQIKDFEKQRKEKTEIITNDILLESEFEKFVNKQYKMYASFLEPIKNKYILGLMNRGILPRFVKGRFKNLLLNIIRTESHRDILLKILSK